VIDLLVVEIFGHLPLREVVPGDLLRLASGNLVPAEEGLRSQWGTRPPEKFRGHVSP